MPEKTGHARLLDALTTKGTAVTRAERRKMGLLGLLPTAEKTLAQQALHCWHEFSTYREDLDKHIYLRGLQDRNETLFYRVLRDHIPETMPIVYTPTVGEACQRFSEIYRRPRGLFVSYPDRELLGEVLRNRPQRDVDVIVVTDGQRILGLGDQGIGGMGIPIGKLSLYTALGGIDPARTLPVLLDVGTDNTDLLNDPLYLGWCHHRVDGDDYDAFVGRFVEAVMAELPNVLVQWEDFATPHALPILEHYRDRLLTFNDDIQGTAAVALGALAAAAEAAGSRMRDQRLVMVGAGSAGIGVSEHVIAAMMADGLSREQARSQLFLIDVDGLLTSDRRDLDPRQRQLAQPVGAVAAADGGPPSLFDVVQAVRPTALVGLSTAAGAFTEEVVRSMAAHAECPIIMPLSNPTSCSEAHPQNLADWTDGRALVATGSPFPPMQINGRHVPVAQCNNVYAFPGIGLAVTAVRARRITDGMLTAAAHAIGAVAPIHSDRHAPLLPARRDLVRTADLVAQAVAEAAVAEGVAPELSPDEIAQAIRRTRWAPAYPDS